MPLILIAVAVLALPLILAVILLACRRSTSDQHSVAYTNHLRSDAWRTTSRATIAITQGRCCLLPWRKAVHAHHLHYGNLHHERAVRDLVPVSDFGHRIAHAWIFWRGPGRLPMSAWMRCMTILVAFWVRPWVRYPVLITAGLSTWWIANLLSGMHLTPIESITHQLESLGLR